MKILDELTLDEKGLIPAIVQDKESGEVLMLAHMNKAALAKTIQSGMTHFWSRSRQKLWLKGESSGHIQKVRGIYVDCDNDTLLIKVDQEGGACHAGYRSCFYREAVNDGEGLEFIAEKIFDPQAVYGKKEHA